MKYILIIFIFASFLFSQVTDVKIVSSNTQTEAVDESGRPINPRSDINMVIDEHQNEIREASYNNSIEREVAVDENGRPINPRSDINMVIDGKRVEMSEDANNINFQQREEALDEKGVPINPQ